MGLKPMDDAKIVQLYWERNERAIPATSEKYGRYCASIARNILGSREDAEECVNDTYLSAWNSMPPHRPDILSAFLGKKVELPLDEDLFYEELMKRVATSRRKTETQAVFADTSSTYGGNR